jgi:hypothetical protein
LTPATIPMLAELERPSGSPIATTNVPTAGVVVAQFATGRLVRATLRTAVSEYASLASTFAATCLPSAN